MFSRLNENLTLLNVHCVKQVGAMDKQTRFADYLRNVMKKKRLSYGDVVKGSESGISKGRLSQILAGQFTVLKSTTIYALAKGVDEDPERLLKMLGMGKFESGLQDFIIKQIEIPKEVWDFIETDARRTLRSPDDHVRAILGAYSKLEQVELKDMESVRSEVSKELKAEESQRKNKPLPVYDTPDYNNVKEDKRKINSHLAIAPSSAMPDYDYDGIYYELKSRYNLDHLTIKSVMAGDDKISVTEEIKKAILEVASRHLKNPDWNKKVGNQ